MKYKASIDVIPLKTLLDPQGKAVNNVLKNNGYTQVENVRIGKHITLEVEAANKKEASAKVKEISSTVLINPVIEEFSFKIEEI
ncbi:MAG: phosphoribosylformylglycinamidine synthase [Candidatus Zixiibacteriota bacterium]|nr:MAG: phosphoribosylformylglycinamidine synthase [candidate division Zixibacteria bacterium]